MPACCIYGKMGSNKSHFALWYALLLANKYEKPNLVANFPLDPDALFNYCKLYGHSWLLGNLKFWYCDTENGGVDKILSLDDSVVIFDEVALYITSRDSAHHSTRNSLFHKELTQIRHRRNYLIVIAQNQKQIDSSIRNLAEDVIHCEGFSVYSKELRSQKLIYRSARFFTPDNYEVWVANPRLRRNPIKSKLLGKKFFGGFLTIADSYLFNVYSSFALVHESGKHIIYPDSKIAYEQEIKDKVWNSQTLKHEEIKGFRWQWFTLPPGSPYSKFHQSIFKKVPVYFLHLWHKYRVKYPFLNSIKLNFKTLYIPSKIGLWFDLCIFALLLACVILSLFILVRSPLLFIFLLFSGLSLARKFS